MNHSELVASVQDKLGLTGVEAKRTVEAVFEAVSEAIAGGAEISVSNFGKFKVKDLPARAGRNPATGAEIQIAASRKVSFAPSKALKDRMG